MKARESEAQLVNAKKQLEQQYARKREQVLQKINTMKRQNKSIEDIYKYTNDIIFEEDNESN